LKKIFTVIAIGLLCLSLFSAFCPKGQALSTAEIERVTNNTEDDFGPSLCVDHLGRPHIAWIRGAPSAYDIYYGVKTGSCWSISKVTSITASSAFHLSLCLDSNEDPHIAALTETSRWDLWYIYWSESASSWIVESVANGGSQSHRNVVSLALDSDNSPHIAWAARWGSGLWGIFYAVKSAAGWSIETISHDDDTAPSIALDSYGEPHVLWNHIHYFVNPRLQYASRVDGTWIIEDIPGGEKGDTNNPRQLIIDSFDVPHIAFNKVPSLGHSELWYGNKTHGSWLLTRIKDSTFNNFFSSLSLSTSEVPYIAFVSNETEDCDVYLATKIGESWDVAQITHDSIDEGNVPGPSLYVDSTDNVNLAWCAPQIGSGDSEIYCACVSLYMRANIDVTPNTLNLRSNGYWITAYVELTESFDVHNINVSSILLNKTIPVAQSAPVAIGDYDNDGIPDLMVKFDRATVESWIYQSVGMRYSVQLTITGKLLDRTSFEGTDTISVIWNGQRAPCKR
jgi:hypothetical protein